jgi:hypothetical protein
MTEWAAAAPKTSKASTWEDFIDIFHSPSDVYARRENNGFFVPLLFLAATMTVLYYVTLPLLQPVFDAEFSRQIDAATRANPQVTREQMEQGRRVFETFGGVAVFFTILLMPLVLGCVLWIVGKFFDSKQTLASACVVATYAYFPRLLEQIVNAAQGFFIDPASVTSRFSITLGLGRFIDPSNALLLALLGRVDVFTIWVTVLFAIGLKVTGKIPMARAAAAATLVWLIGAIPAIFGAVRAG